MFNFSIGFDVIELEARNMEREKEGDVLGERTRRICVERTF